MTIEAMKQALEALEGWANHGKWVWPESALDQCKRNTAEAITALRTAIEQAEKQEPYARIYETESPFGLHRSLDYRPYNGRNPDRVVPVYTALRTAIEQAQEDNEQLIYDAWRDSEAYGIPMTEEGEKLAEIRLRSFRRGWEYHRFYLKHGDVYMKDYLERQDYDE